MFFEWRCKLSTPNWTVHTLDLGGKFVEKEMLGNGIQPPSGKINPGSKFDELRSVIANPGVWNCRIPNTPLAKSFLSEVRKETKGIVSKPETIYLYSALNSPLDICYGVDGFFFLKLPKYSSYGYGVVTFDVSLRQKHRHPRPGQKILKADVLVRFRSPNAQEELQRSACLVAKKIAKIIHGEDINSILYL